MKSLALSSLLLLCFSLLSADATAIHGQSGLAGRHAVISNSSQLTRRTALSKRCVNLKAGLNPNASASGPSASQQPAPASPSPAPLPGSAPGNGRIQVNEARCGPNAATNEITPTSGPNGQMDWLNCGFESGGWNPPNVQIKDIIVVPLDVALQNPNNPFGNCAPFLWAFEQYGNQLGIPPILLASFAMQESSCDPSKVGGAGEQGLMQITVDKCGNAPGGNCHDPGYNIATAAQFFKNTLDANGGNVVLSAALYNGWRIGLTPATAFAAADTGCCACQNNGDYLMKLFNGWILNVDPSDHNGMRLGKYFNLDKCNS